MEDHDEIPFTPDNELHSSNRQLIAPCSTIWHKLSNINYMTFLSIGIALLWPWNCLLNSSPYFQANMFHDNTIYSNIYTSTMMSTSTITSVVSNIWLLTWQHNYVKRIIRGLIIQAGIFIILCILILHDSTLSLWFKFVFIMISTFISSIGTAMTQNGTMAMSNMLGTQFNQAVMVGQAIAGVISSLMLFLISLLKQSSGIDFNGILIYFNTTTVISLMSIILYKFSTIHDYDLQTNLLEDELDSNIPFMVLFYKLKYLVLSIFITFSITVLFPIFAVNTFVARLPISNESYIPMIFLIWNLGDLSGRIISDYPFFQSSRVTPVKIFVYSLLRIGMVPIFFIFNVRGSSKIKSQLLLDLFYIMWQFLFGITNGNIISLSFMKVRSQLSKDKERKAAGAFTNIFVSTGLAFGSIISYAFAYILTKVR